MSQISVLNIRRAGEWASLSLVILAALTLNRFKIAEALVCIGLSRLSGHPRSSVLMRPHLEVKAEFLFYLALNVFASKPLHNSPRQFA
jgi:hypothetical protein